LQRKSQHRKAAQRISKQRGKPVMRVCRVVLAQGQGSAWQRKEAIGVAAQRIATQSNAGYPLCGYPESFWLKGMAMKGTAVHRIEAQRTAPSGKPVNGIEKQRGKPVMRVCRVVLAQGQRMSRHSKAPHRTASKCVARHRKATRTVCSSSRLFESFWLKCIAPQCSAAHCGAMQRIAIHSLAMQSNAVSSFGELIKSF